MLTGRLRALLISTAGHVSHESYTTLSHSFSSKPLLTIFHSTITEARKRFDAYVSGDTSSLNPSLRIPILRIGVEHGGASAYESVKTLFTSTQSGEVREACLAALGRASEPSLVRDALAFAFSPAVPPQDLHSIPGALAKNSAARPELWKWIKENWDGVVEKTLKSNTVVGDRFVRLALSDFSQREVKQDVEAFFEGKDTKAFQRAVVQVLDSVESNTKYRERDEGTIEEWLKEKEFGA